MSLSHILFSQHHIFSSDDGGHHDMLSHGALLVRALSRANNNHVQTLDSTPRSTAGDASEGIIRSVRRSGIIEPGTIWPLQFGYRGMPFRDCTNRYRPCEARKLRYSQYILLVSVIVIATIRVYVMHIIPILRRDVSAKRAPSDTRIRACFRVRESSAGELPDQPP